MYLGHITVVFHAYSLTNLQVNVEFDMQVSGNCVYAVPGDIIHSKEEVQVPEFPRQDLQFVEKLGEGQFGEVVILSTLCSVFKFLIITKWKLEYVVKMCVTFHRN